ncbi:hypothetical protein SRB5_28250 [Streptomyces sp. RB5]|uniref:Nosiheptide resistance regulatory protein n=1 Tax=Streptomyces smaragdinus TaxID=2585196 RepID=A0A7K0CGT6_9ACTN|nr:hypothetical protein [Streptomyces smaragdinus]
MTRNHSAHTASATVRHAAEVVAPYASSARDQYLQIAGQCAHYAAEARGRYGPKVAGMAQDAHQAYGTHVAPRMRKARAKMPDGVDRAATRAADGTRRAALYTAPRVIGAAVATRQFAVPVARETWSRSHAALHALRGHITPEEIDALARRRRRRSVAGRAARNAAVAGVLGAGAVAAWRWWDRQVNPDWLVEPPAAAEVRQEARIEDDTEYMDREARVEHAETSPDTDLDTEQQPEDLNEAGEPTDTTRAYYEREDDR